MNFSEDEIDFSALDSARFEELCYDVLARLGFQKMAWRRGGADSGRDIECEFTTSFPLVGPVTERWFVECKNHARGVPPEELSSKFAWADAERPDRLFIVVSSYLTDGARDWLRKRIATTSYRVHVFEGKEFRRFLVGYQDLLERYFADRVARLLRHTYESWLLHDLLPSPNTLSVLVRDLPNPRLTPGEVAFLWILLKVVPCDGLPDDEVEREKLIERMTEQIVNFGEASSSSVLDEYSKARHNGWSQFSIHGLGDEWGESIFATVRVWRETQAEEGLYACVGLTPTEAVEILVTGSARPSAVVRRFVGAAERRAEAERRLRGESGQPPNTSS